MNSSTRRQRLLTDLETLRQLKQQSEIFDFEYEGELPDRYTISLRGRGIGGEPRPGEPLPLIALHRIDLRLPYSYPQRPPDIRWLTPLFHPNVSFSGFINVADMGLPWDPACTLDVVCERLWDVARLAYLDLDQAANYTARACFAGDHGLALPLDARPLRTRASDDGANTIRYQRRGGSPTAAKAATTNPSHRDVFYINEDTPVPELPQGRHRGDADGDVFYIGEE